MSGRVGSITTDIVVDGLVFNMDPANRACYPKTGTTVTNTVLNQTGTINGSTFLSTHKGILNFDGGDDYLDFGTPSELVFASSAQFTKSMWIQKTGDQPHVHVIFQQRRTMIGIGYTGVGGTITNKPYTYIGASTINGTTTLSDDVWYNIAVTYNNTSVKLYVNGILEATGTRTLESDSGSTVFFGKSSSGNFFEGNISNCIIYNRALSSTEILKNFNALKDRIGYVAPLIVSFLVVAGGGASAGSGTAIGGAGAGGLRTSFGSTSGGGASAEDDLTLEPGTSYTVTVGAGAAGSNGTNAGPRGNDSIFSTITSKGGGNGGSGNVDNAGTRELSFPPSDRTKGSGGGAGRNWGQANSIGIGTTGQGMDGNYSRYGGSPTMFIGGGGGGASQDGYHGNSAPNGGGDGLDLSSILGTNVGENGVFAGGGGGSVYDTAGASTITHTNGGNGGGGNGGKRNGLAPTDALANTGGGGGGPKAGSTGADKYSSNGGSGVIIIKYPSSNSLTVGAGLTSTTSTSGGYKTTIFTAGTDTISFS